MHKLLLIDDDREMLEITEEGFREQGYAVMAMHSGENAVACIEECTPDCVILDVRIPGSSGFDICEDIRMISDVPIIFLTGSVSEDDKVRGLLLGADDYVEKPYSFRELEARVRAAIRRTQEVLPGKLLFPPLEIDIENHRASCDGQDLQLTTQEYNILYFLATSKKDVITYMDIGKQIWGSYREQDRSSVMVMISRLRKKLEVNPITAELIETVWSKGYKFIGKRSGGQRYVQEKKIYPAYYQAGRGSGSYADGAKP